MGSIAIVKFSEEEAQLRWLLLEPRLRGRGPGRQLVKEALDFCRATGYSSVFLWTVSQLNAAAELTNLLASEEPESRHTSYGAASSLRSDTT